MPEQWIALFVLFLVCVVIYLFGELMAFLTGDDCFSRDAKILILIVLVLSVFVWQDVKDVLVLEVWPWLKGLLGGL